MRIKFSLNMYVNDDESSRSALNHVFSSTIKLLLTFLFKFDILRAKAHLSFLRLFFFFIFRRFSSAREKTLKIVKFQIFVVLLIIVCGIRSRAP